MAVAAVWGWTFVMVKDAVTLYPTLQFLALRFSLAACVVGLVVVGGRLRRRALPAPREAAADTELFPLVVEGPSAPQPVARARRGVTGRRSGSTTIRRSFRGALGGGALMGLALGAGYVFQTFGLERTTASNAGFITGLMVVLVPVLQGLVWRRWIRGGALAGVLLAAAGLYLISGGAGRTPPAGRWACVPLCTQLRRSHPRDQRIRRGSRYLGADALAAHDGRVDDCGSRRGRRADRAVSGPCPSA